MALTISRSHSLVATCVNTTGVICAAFPLIQKPVTAELLAKKVHMQEVPAANHDHRVMQIRSYLEKQRS